jgi:hypothetical protein
VNIEKMDISSSTGGGMGDLRHNNVVVYLQYLPGKKIKETEVGSEKSCFGSGYG